MDVQMSKAHQTTYKAIFQHPVARNLQWHDNFLERSAAPSLEMDTKASTVTNHTILTNEN